MTQAAAIRIAARYVESFHVEAMSNLLPRRTGVRGAVIWVSPGEFSGVDVQHGPRIKVMLGEKTTTEGLHAAVSVTLTNPPRVLGVLPGRVRGQVFAFINKNLDVLLRHWRGELDPGDVLELIERV